jgi:hypothetical protein
MLGLPTTDCYCCEVRHPDAHLIDDLHPSTAQPATYRWTNHIGDAVPLCVDCCAEWRECTSKPTHLPSLLDAATITQLRTIR